MTCWRCCTRACPTRAGIRPWRPGDSNLFIDKRDRLYFIDLGRGGVADPWMDIAFAHRNLSEEISPAFADRLLAELPYPDQPERRRYFQQLDELF